MVTNKNLFQILNQEVNKCALTTKLSQAAQVTCMQNGDGRGGRFKENMHLTSPLPESAAP